MTPERLREIRAEVGDIEASDNSLWAVWLRELLAAFDEAQGRIVAARQSSVGVIEFADMRRALAEAQREKEALEAALEAERADNLEEEEKLEKQLAEAERERDELRHCHETLNKNLRKLGQDGMADVTELSLRAGKAEAERDAAIREREEMRKGRVDLAVKTIKERDALQVELNAAIREREEARATLATLIRQTEGAGYECEAGPLENLVAWREAKAALGGGT